MGRLGAALGLEVVIEAGDALYVPALWFHYITSLTTNIQCNTRSGERGGQRRAKRGAA